MSYSPKPSPVLLKSNLQSFIHSVTPTVPSGLANKSSIDKKVETFTLGDLWEVYDEWSAYGRGVPVVYKTDDKKDNIAVQYYVPHLSGIQIYTNKPAHLISNDQGAPWESRDPRRCLYFEYFERSSPYTRAPLVNKIVEFAAKFPGLCTLRNTDLAPGSWISVAWYPIYPIPAMGHGRDLSACFLSFHTLSASFQDEDLAIGGDGLDDGEMFGGGKCKEGLNSLRPFGLATYKLEEHFWLKDADDCEKVFHLYSAADSWLRQLDVNQHHDFNFFSSHSPLAGI